MAVALAVAMLPAAGAHAVVVYGGLRGLPGRGGCLHDVTRQASSAGRCPGAAAGLQGAAAVALSPDGRSLYVASPQAGALVTLERDRRNGLLRPPLAPSSRDCMQAFGGGACAQRDPALSGADALAISPDGRFLYAGGADSASVSAFARGARGLLRPLPRIVSVTGPSPGHAGRRRRVSYGCVDGDPIAGAPPPGCGASAKGLEGVSALAVSPDGRNVYAVSYGPQAGEDSIVALARDPLTGGLSPLRGPGGCVQSRPAHSCSASAAGLEGASAVAVSLDGRFVYVASPLSGAVVAFARNGFTGRVAALRGLGACVSAAGEKPPGRDLSCASTASQLSGARALAISPDGREVYVAAFDPGAVVALARDPSSGRIGPLGGPALCLQALADAACPTPVPGLRQAVALSLSPDGRLLFAASEGGDSVIELLRDATSGHLTLAASGARAVGTLSGPQALTVSRDGRDLYLASPFDDAVAGLAI